MRIKLAFIILFIILFLSGCNNYDVINEGSYNYPPINPLPSEDKLEVILFYPNQQLTHLVPEFRIVNKDSNDLNSIVIKELFNGTKKKGLVNIIPNNVKLISVDVLDGTAYVNLSNDLKDNKISEKEEAFTLYSIVNTLCRLSDINAVQILIEGKTSDKFINVYSIKEPLSYSSLIVNEDYLNIITVVRDFYESIRINDFDNMLDLLYLKDHDNSKIGILKAEFDMLCKDIEDYEISSYVINKYDEDIEIISDVKLYDYTNFGNKEYKKISRQFVLIYEGNSFKIKKYVDY